MIKKYFPDAVLGWKYHELISNYPNFQKKKLFTGWFTQGEFISFNIPSKLCLTILTTFVIFEFLYHCFLQNFDFELNFLNSSNFEIFFEKVSKIIKNCPYFLVIFFWIIVFESTIKLYKMATLNFRVPLLKVTTTFLYVLWKSNDIFLWFLVENIWKNFENFSYFLLESPAGMIENATLYFFFKYVLVFFLRTYSYSKS
jgi:hypothetical protein